MVKRKRLVAIASAVLLAGLLAFGVFVDNSTAILAHPSGPVTTIKGLHTISVVGTTSTILDANGNTITVDGNPYGVAIAPPGTPPSSTLNPGDIVVSNFGATSTGTTLVRFPGKKGPGQLFNTVPADPGTSGPAAEAFNSIGDDWVANFSGNNVQIFTPDGNVLASISRPLFNKPWGQAFNNGTPNPADGSIAAFFVTNAGDGTLDRLSIAITSTGVVIRAYQIGRLGHASTRAVPVEAPQGMAWVPSWTWDDKTYSDVLFVTDPANDRIAAYPNSSTRNTTSQLSDYRGMTVFKDYPLHTPAGLAINPLNGHLLVVNQRDNNLVEINPSPRSHQNQVVAVRTLDPAQVNLKTGANSALFGLAATTDASGNLEVYFTDDNTNTLNVLSV